MDEIDKEIVDPLHSLELSLERRIVRAPLRSPETLFEELNALELALDLKAQTGNEPTIAESPKTFCLARILNQYSIVITAS